MGKREVTGTVSGKGGGLMYIHGLIDGALIVIVLEVITMIAAVVFCSKRK